MNKERQSFTLIELLVVIAILAILSVSVVLVLNPSDLIKQSRDSTRLTDLNNLNKALGLFQVTNPGSFQGTSTVVYVSIPDTTTTCANLGLPTLPAGYTYNCVSTSTLAKNDGTGWIPVAFSQISYGSVISKLPTDPINATSSGEYYQYIPGGSWVLTALLTSQKYHTKAIDDNGYDPDRFEIGSNLSLNQPVSGLLAAYFQQPGSGLSATDYSNRGNTGTITIGTSTGWDVDQHGNANLAYLFDGANTRINTGSDWLGVTTATISAWIYINSYGEGGNYGRIFSNSKTEFSVYNSGALQFRSDGASSPFSGNSISLNQWYYVTVTRTSAGIANFYVNGVQSGTANQSSGTPAAGTTNVIIGNNNNPTNTFDGRIADFRAYTKILSIAEIKAIYNATK